MAVLPPKLEPPLCHTASRTWWRTSQRNSVLFAQSMDKKWESKSGKFPNRSTKQSPGCPSHQNKWHWGNAAGAEWGWLCHVGGGSERRGCPHVQWNSSGPYQMSDRKGQQSTKVWRRFGKVWALVCDYEEMFSIDRFYPRTCSTTVNASGGLIYRTSFKEIPGKGWGVLVKSPGSAWVRDKLNN